MHTVEEVEKEDWLQDVSLTLAKGLISASQGQMARSFEDLILGTLALIWADREVLFQCTIRSIFFTYFQHDAAVG